MGDYLTSNLLPRKIGHYPATPADVGFSYSPGNVSDSNSVLSNIEEGAYTGQT